MEWDVEKLSNSKWTKKIMGIVLLLLVALLSFNKISVVTSSPETYASMIESLDEKRNTVTGLIATSTATSAAITVLPDDVGTPIAEKNCRFEYIFSYCIRCNFFGENFINCRWICYF